MKLFRLYYETYLICLLTCVLTLSKISPTMINPRETPSFIPTGRLISPFYCLISSFPNLLKHYSPTKHLLNKLLTAILKFLFKTETELCRRKMLNLARRWISVFWIEMDLVLLDIVGFGLLIIIFGLEAAVVSNFIRWNRLAPWSKARRAGNSI